MSEKSTAVEKKQSDLPAWAEQKEQLEIVRKTYAPSLNEIEFKTFVMLAAAAGANPFLREIWAYKIKDRNVIFLGRDHYRNIAQKKEDYRGHKSVAVYENDDFELVNGMPEHKSKPHKKEDRGALVGAYAIGHREGMEPFAEYVDLAEYDKGQSTWNSLKTTMVKKVAEAHLLKLMYNKDYPMAYSEAEQGVIEMTAGQNGTFKAIGEPAVVDKKAPAKARAAAVTEEMQNKLHSRLVKMAGSDDAASAWLEKETKKMSEGKFSASSIFEFNSPDWFGEIEAEVTRLENAG